MKDSRRKEIALVASGVLLGATVAGPAASAALTAQQSSQKVYVDGQQVQIEAYSIGGNNYCKLRDVGKAVGFQVSYDPLSNTVRINTNEAYEDATTVTVKLPTDGSQYIPQVGDRILCDDGAEYEIKDVSRWNNNVYQAAKLPALPAPSCDWSKFPTLTLPEPEARHYHDQYGDDLFVRNVYEVRRMVCTIYNALGEEPSAWRDGNPLATVETVIPPEYEAYTAKFWPWRESEDAVCQGYLRKTWIQFRNPRFSLYGCAPLKFFHKCIHITFISHKKIIILFFKDLDILFQCSEAPVSNIVSCIIDI